MINRKNGNDWGANNSLCSFIALFWTKNEQREFLYGMERPFW